LDDRHGVRHGTYRVIYRIDDERHRVTVVAVVHTAPTLFDRSHELL